MSVPLWKCRQNSRQRHNRTTIHMWGRKQNCVHRNFFFLFSFDPCIRCDRLCLIQCQYNIWNNSPLSLGIFLRTRTRTLVQRVRGALSQLSWILSVDYCAPNNLCFFFLCRHRKVIIHRIYTLEYRDCHATTTKIHLKLMQRLIVIRKWPRS